MLLSKPSLLIGAGASVAAGLASTDRITKAVLSGDGVHRSTMEKYYFGHYGLVKEAGKDPYPWRMVECFKIVNSRISKFFSVHGIERLPTYEDMMYYANQLYDCVSGEFENPSLMGELDCFEKAVSPLTTYRAGDCRIKEKFTFPELLREMTLYIPDIVHALLSDLRTVTLDPIERLISPMIARNSGMSVLTLNHDLIIEQYFRSKGIAFNDGFSEASGDLRICDRNEFEKNDLRPRLVKLHGSIDCAYVMDKEAKVPNRIVKIIGSDPYHAKDANGNMPWTEPQPLMLVGTFNKMLSYLNEPYATMYREFEKAIFGSNELVVAGYSFQDKGVNTLILRWMDKCRGRLIVFDLRGRAVFKTARPAIRWASMDWLKEDRCVVFAGPLEQVDLQSLHIDCEITD